MDTTIFFLFFLAGIIPLILGFVKNVPILLIISGILFLGLWAALVIGGFTTPAYSSKLISYTYYPLYGNATLNMTQSTNTTYAYTTITTKDNFTLLLATICLGFGGIGLVIGGGTFVGTLKLA